MTDYNVIIRIAVKDNSDDKLDIKVENLTGYPSDDYRDFVNWVMFILTEKAGDAFYYIQEEMQMKEYQVDIALFISEDGINIQSKGIGNVFVYLLHEKLKDYLDEIQLIQK